MLATAAQVDTVYLCRVRALFAAPYHHLTCQLLLKYVFRHHNLYLFRKHCACCPLMILHIADTLHQSGPASALPGLGLRILAVLTLKCYLTDSQQSFKIIISGEVDELHPASPAEYSAPQKTNPDCPIVLLYSPSTGCSPQHILL